MYHTINTRLELNIPKPPDLMHGTTFKNRAMYNRDVINHWIIYIIDLHARKLSRRNFIMKEILRMFSKIFVTNISMDTLLSFQMFLSPKVVILSKLTGEMENSYSVKY
jgi:hypothetical protein